MNFDAFFVSLLSPMVLAFVLGIIATRLGSDLKFPDAVYTFLTIYLLTAIGIKGGYKLSITPFSELILPLLAGLALSIGIPIWTYLLMRRAKFSVPDAASLAAHYGSVSAVTFSGAIAFFDSLRAQALVASPGLTEAQFATMGLQPEGFLPGLLASMEVPAILIALAIARMRSPRTQQGTQQGAQQGASLGEVVRELLVGRSSLLLLGFLAIGLLTGKSGFSQVAPFFDAPFRGLLTLFLLEAGLVTGRRLGDLRKVGWPLIAFALLMPLVHAVIALFLAHAVGLSLAGAVVFATLAASASYIAAPAATRIALPEANPGLTLTASLVITFPMNNLIGIPLYYALAQLIYGL
jgi:hypothetical protein